MPNGGTDLDLLYKLLVQDEGKQVLKRHQATLKKLTDQEKKALKVSAKQKKAAEAEAKAIDKRRKAREKDLKKLKAFGKAAVAGLAIAGVAAVAFGAKAVQMASNVEEAAAKFDEVFGPAAKRTGDAIDEFAEKAQRSRFALREMAADVGAVLEPMLGSKDAASDMAVQLTKLTTDLSSFNNVAESDVLIALRSGIIGNMEPMLQFGVVLRQSKVNAEVLASGMANTKDEITEAMRVTARFNIIMRETQTAQGDAERTGESFANQMRGLEAAIEEIVIGIGQELLPVAKDLISGLLQLINLGKQTNDELIEMARSEDFFTRALGATSITLNKSNLLINAFTENQRKMQDMVRRGEMTLEEYNKAVEGTANAAIDGGASLEGITRAIQGLEEGTLTALGATRFLTETFGEEIVNAGLVNDELLEMAAAHGNVEARIKLRNMAARTTSQIMEETIPTAEELKAKEEELQAAQESAAESARRQAESLEKMRGRAAEASIEFNNLAQSLSNATKADLAKVAIDGLDESLKAGVITRGEHAEATRNVMLSFGLATEESIRMAESMGDVNQLFTEGKINSDELVEVIANLDENEGNLDRTLEKLGIQFGGLNEVTNENELSNLALIATQQDMTENTTNVNLVLAKMRDRLFNVVEITDEASLSASALSGPVRSAGEAARQSEEDFRAWATAMVESNDIARQIGSGVPLPTAPRNVPQRQLGGPVTEGDPFIVGETGPELFIPSRPGTIVPDSSSSSIVNNNNNRNTRTIISQTINTTQPVDIGRQSNISRNRARSF